MGMVGRVLVEDGALKPQINHTVGRSRIVALKIFARRGTGKRIFAAHVSTTSTRVKDIVGLNYFYFFELTKILRGVNVPGRAGPSRGIFRPSSS